jgi:hypothetical protein
LRRLRKKKRLRRPNRQTKEKKLTKEKRQRTKNREQRIEIKIDFKIIYILFIISYITK